MSQDVSCKTVTLLFLSRRRLDQIPQVHLHVLATRIPGSGSLMYEIFSGTDSVFSYAHACWHSSMFSYFKHVRR